MISLSDPICLSTSGSTRATSYNWSNKALTRAGKTHIVWLDSVATVCGKTFDHASQSWGDTIRIADGSDNHTCPCITADEDGHIRLTYGPHGWFGDWNQAQVKWKRTERPGDLTSWEPEGEGYRSSWSNFGYNATAASIVHTPGGYDAVVCRGGEHPPSTMFHRQRETGGWTSAKSLFTQDVDPQYTHHYGHITCGSEGTLYAACHFYNIGGSDNNAVTGDSSRMRSYGAAILQSTDMGDTWQSLAGRPINTPTLYKHPIAIPPFDHNIYVNSITLDNSGNLWAITLNPSLESDIIWLNRWSGKGWDTIQIESHVPEGYVAVESMMTIDTSDNLHILVSGVDPLAVGKESHWGHPSSEIFYLHSSDKAQSFTCDQISPSDPRTPSWLPSISRPGPFHPVKKPVIIYTHGSAGAGTKPNIQTEVWCLMVN